MKIFFLTLFLLISFSSAAKLSEKPEDVLPLMQKICGCKFFIGSSELTFFGAKVYDISLWTVDDKFSYEKPFAIRIKYNMNFDKNDLAKRSITEIKKLHELTKDQEDSYLEQLLEILHSVKKGDEKIAIFDPQNGVSMIYNGKIIGKISDIKLARFFVDIWLDQRGSYPEVTRKVLGLR